MSAFRPLPTCSDWPAALRWHLRWRSRGDNPVRRRCWWSSHERCTPWWWQSWWSLSMLMICWHLDHSIGSCRLPPRKLGLEDIITLYWFVFFVNHKFSVLHHHIIGWIFLIDLDACVSHWEHLRVPRRRWSWTSSLGFGGLWLWRWCFDVFEHYDNWIWCI